MNIPHQKSGVSFSGLLCRSLIIDSISLVVPQVSGVLVPSVGEWSALAVKIEIKKLEHNFSLTFSPGCYKVTPLCMNPQKRLDYVGVKS